MCPGCACVHDACVYCDMCVVMRRLLCGVASLSLPSGGLWGLNSGHQAWMASTFICWTILPAHHGVNFKRSNIHKSNECLGLQNNQVALTVTKGCFRSFHDLHMLYLKTHSQALTQVPCFSNKYPVLRKSVFVIVINLSVPVIYRNTFLQPVLAFLEALTTSNQLFESKDSRYYFFCLSLKFCVSS